ncbi:hypothetical protein EDC94DRAFT_596566 [Helicostylum pulchrum]|nr:hypothetical protein EDC94DRAFT_596566 [Helicostylum pulchrum]
MCFGSSKGPKWKREVVKDHKFDFIDIEEFRDNSCPARFSYSFMFMMILKSILTMTADLYTAISLLVIGNASINADASIPPEVAKWIFLGAIMISFVLLFWDIIKSRSIIASRDISLAFFSAIANGWYSTKDYNYFCLFRKINDSRKSTDSIAFFVFFTLKSWKRVLLAEAPRQVINVVTLITILPKWIKINDGLTIVNTGLGKTLMQQVMTGTMIFSTFVFAISFILICIAAIIYIPLLCHIRGNLKEYCCHKVDKRIEELLKKQARKRIKANESNNHTKKSKKEDIEMRALPQPTLPNVDMNTLNAPATTKGPRYHHQPQPSFTSQSTVQRPGFYQHPSSSNMSFGMESQFGGGRRNSLSSVGSDQVGLTKNAQPQPWSSSPYQNNNHSNSNLSHNIHHQQYQQSQQGYHGQQYQQRYQQQPQQYQQQYQSNNHY